MIFTNTLFLLPFLIGFTFVLAAYIQTKFPPKKINHAYGYRTARAMKSEEAWKFAQSYSARIMTKMGLFLIFISFTGFLVDPGSLAGVLIGLGLMTVSIIYLFTKIESAIKSRFKD